MVSTNQFREAMSQLSAAVNVITTDGPLGRSGFTATAVCSVSDTPPTVLVCVYRGSRTAPVLKANGVLGVNVLNSSQDDVAELFAGRGGVPMEDRFHRHAWCTSSNGLPILESALVSLVCTVTEIKELGTHDVVFARVDEVVRHPGCSAPLVYFDRVYGAVAQATRTLGEPDHV